MLIQNITIIKKTIKFFLNFFFIKTFKKIYINFFKNIKLKKYKFF